MNLVTTSNAVIWSFTSIAIVFVALRLISRLRLSRAAGVDDIVICASLFIYVTASVLYSYSASKGIGKSITDLTPVQRVEATKYGVISNSVSVHSATWPKLSIVILLHRVFNPRRSVLVLLYLLATSLIFFSCLLTIMNFTQCRPAEGFWNPSIEASCWSPSVFEGFGIFTGFYSALFDLFLALYPLPIIWKLQMKLARKLALSVVLGLSLLACIAAIVKSTQLFRLQTHSNLTYDFAEIDIWQSVETTVIHVAACIPTLGPLVACIKTNGRSIAKMLSTKYQIWRSISSLHDTTFKHDNQHFGPDEDNIDLVPWENGANESGSPKDSKSSVRSSEMPGAAAV